MYKFDNPYSKDLVAFNLLSIDYPLIILLQGKMLSLNFIALIQKICYEEIL